MSEDGRPAAPGSPSSGDALRARIRRAETPPGALYASREELERQAEEVFASSWQLVPCFETLAAVGDARPFDLLPGLLDEPLVLVRDEPMRLRVLSNACTHRGALVVEQACRLTRLRCRYHARTFGLDGAFQAAPGFEGAEDFPRPEDDLQALPVGEWGGIRFTTLGRPPDFDEVLAPVRERMAFVDIDAHRPDPTSTRSFEVDGSWAAYVDNYLEGLHVPFIHPGLDATLDWNGYDYELFDGCCLQLCPAADGEPAFELPEGHPQAGRRIAAFYWFVFPNCTLNFYPWGVSVNLIEPVGPSRTRVRYFALVRDEELRRSGAGGSLDSVEHEDDEIVASAQRGLGSRLYGRGRYAPRHELALLWFHERLFGSG